MTDQIPPDPFSFEERERTGRNAGLIHPQDGPEAPDAGPGTPDGAGGRQADAEPVARLRRLRAQLAAERAKAVAADQQPRPDLDHLRVTAHNGIAAGLETALFFVDHHLREVGEARTTPDNGATSGDAADKSLREQCAAALWQAAEFNIIAEWICCEPLNPKHELCAQGYAAMRMIKALIVDDPEAAKPAPLADAVLAVRDREMEQQYATRAALIRDQSALAQIRLHIAAHRPRLQYADPILLGRLEAVLRQVGELEAAGGGERA